MEGGSVARQTIQPDWAIPEVDKSAGSYVPIKASSLVTDSVVDFDIFIQWGDIREPVLYRDRGLEFTEDIRRRLLSQPDRRLFIHTGDTSAYQRYMERHLSEVMADPSISTKEKSVHLYLSAQGLVRETLAEPRSGELMERSGRIVRHLVDFLYTHSHSFEFLLEVTSYDYYTYTHSVNVMIFSTALAQHVGFSEMDVRELGQGALLHDVGKSRIDPSLTNWPGKLSPQQWEEMKTHPVHGYDILRERGTLSEVILAVTLWHHEKLDGSGYPDGIDGASVLDCVRIVTIADIFDALTTRRSYKNALSSFDALKLMRQEMYEQLDKKLFRDFVMLMGRNGSGKP